MTTTTIIIIAAIASTLTGGIAFVVGYAFGVRSEHELHERERKLGSEKAPRYGGLKL